MTPWPSHRRADEHGAAAVEMALCLLILIPMVLGLVQYGLIFNDSLQVRQAARDSARTGVVQTAITDVSGCTPAPTDYSGRLACHALKGVAPVSGKTAVRVAAPSGWGMAKPLVVCVVTLSAGATAGIVPVPDSGYVRARTTMSIEKPTAPTGTFPAYASSFTPATGATDPSDATSPWAWCT